MADSVPRRLYRLRVGRRIYENISIAVVIKNIKSGKLDRDHEIASAGSDRWTPLGSVPQLQAFFSPVAEGFAPAPAQPTGLYYLRVGGEERSHQTRKQLIEMIRKGEFKETDQIRTHPHEPWKMAGDAEDLHRYFDLRRRQIAEKGFAAERGDVGPPFYLDIAGPFKYIANPRFLVNVIAILVFFAIAILVPIPLVSGPINFLATFYIYAYYFRVVSNAGVGGTTFPEFTDMADFIGELIRPAVQFFLTRVAALAPLISYIWFVRFADMEFWFKVPIAIVALNVPYLVLVFPVVSMDVVTLPDGEITFQTNIEFLFSDPFVWLLLAFWLLYVPISLMRQASYGQYWPVFNLVAFFKSVFRAFGPYIALIAFLLAVDIIGGCIILLLTLLIGFATITAPVADEMMQFSAPFELLFRGLMMLGTFIKMYFIGRFVYQYAERMGWD